MRHFAWLVLLSLVTASAEAAAPAGEEAKTHVRKATAAYNLGKYGEAAREFEAAYELTLDANMLFNVAQTYRLSGQTDKAITAYRSFIRSAPKSDQRGLAEAKLRELEQQRTAEPASTPPPAATAAPVPPPATPAPPPAATTPPPPAPPAPSRMEPSAPPPNLSPAPPASNTAGVSTIVSTPAPPPESHFYQRWPFWTGVGVVVAGGAALAIVLASQHDGLSMPPTKFGTKGY